MPKNARETTAATTLATTIGGKALALKEPTISSSAKKAPASGALNAAEIPAAAPAATSTVVRLAGNRNQRPSAEPIAAPNTATGPSAPADPPPPIVTALAAVRASAGWVGMSPPARTTARWTSGTVMPSLPRANRFMMYHAAAMPEPVTSGR